MKILITGAASGLGRHFIESYAQQGGHTILGIDKNPLPKEIQALTDVHELQVDLTSESALASLQTQLKSQPLDLVIHSAGIRGLVRAMEDKHPDDVAICETADVMDVETMSRTLQINSIATFSLIKSVIPSLSKGSNPKVVIMSSRMGSIGQNTGGSAYAYRASKAAVNAIVKSFSIDFPSITFILCHPGRVETGLVRSKEPGAIPAAESVEGLLPLIEGWTGADSGRFFDRFGATILW